MDQARAEKWYQRISAWQYMLISVGLVSLTALILYLMGQVPWCKCGFVRLWHGVVFSSENSQHLSDWYTFTHVIHGFGFYLLFKLFFPRLPVPLRLLMAIALEGAWEILENTDFIINRYREVTISLDYFGDSVINSVSDILAMVIGFFLASRIRVSLSIAFIIALEVMLAYFIRDNLLINIVMLLYPLDWLKAWQVG
ncbi:MAG: DUF2585 domain-containing protein [Candidatus Vogelbacteria bacterium]